MGFIRYGSRFGSKSDFEDKGIENYEGCVEIPAYIYY